MNKKTLFILDNASFHKSSEIEKIAKKNHSEVLYLPPYSPDLNPIERYWHELKTEARKYLRDGMESISKAINRFFKKGKMILSDAIGKQTCFLKYQNHRKFEHVLTYPYFLHQCHNDCFGLETAMTQ